MSLHDVLLTDVTELGGELIRLRRQLHRRPEIGLILPETQETLLRELDGLGLEVTQGAGLSSITAVLRGKPTGAAVLLRADMDALPVTEAGAVDFRSEIDGAMHACGHDLHMAMLVGGARLLAAHREFLDGDVVFMFQPGEEGWDGAGKMIDEGVLDAAGYRVNSAYGMHVMAGKYPTGVFCTRPGTLMASSGWLRVTVLGRGGHGSTPHLGRDPITAAAEMITSLQTFVTRRFDIFDPVVITVGRVLAGTKRNIIPDTAEFDATVRTFSAQSLERVRVEAPELCRRIAQAYGLDIDVQYLDEYPLTINDDGHTAFAQDVVTEVFGTEAFQPMPHPEAGAEDFSRVLAEVPGCYLMLGAAPGNQYRDAASNHSSRATFDDAVLTRGALLHAEIAFRALTRDAASAGGPDAGSGSTDNGAATAAGR